MSAQGSDGTAIIDENYPRNIDEIVGIECRGIVYLILRLIREDVIDKSEAKQIIDKMIDD